MSALAKHAGAPSTTGIRSYAGMAPTNAAALAKAHQAFPADLPPLTAGPTADVQLTLVDRTIHAARIAPNVAFTDVMP